MGIVRLVARGSFSLAAKAPGRAFACAALMLLTLTASAANINVTVDSSQTFQVIDGFGVNANHRSFTNNEVTPVLDALIDQAGISLFRVVFDNADWEATNDNSNSHVMNWDYYKTIYSSPDFQKMWDLMAYLNQKGITKGVMPNFQGFGPSWMGGLSLTPGFEDEWAETITSALVYARYTNHLQFSLVAPNNEPDLPGTGVGIADGTEYALTLHKLAQQLDANGLGDLRFVGPDRSDSGTNWLPEIMKDSLVMSKLGHFGLHSYSDYGTWSYGVQDFIEQSAYPKSTFWMTEFNVWCEPCQASISGTNSWDYAFGTAEYLLYHLANNASAAFIWEAYDSHFFNNYDSNMHWSYWGLFGIDNINAPVKTYTPRKAYYTMSQISKFVRPGAQRIAVSPTGSSMVLLGFYHPDTKQLTLTGINYDDNATTLSADLSSLPGVENLELYVTTASANLVHAGTVGVTNGSISTAIPGYSVFTLTGYVPSAITILTQPSGGIVRSGATTTLNVDATGTAALNYQWQRNKVNIPGATNASLTLANIKAINARDAGTYRVVITSTGSTLISSNALLLVDQKVPSLSVTTPRSGTRVTTAAATIIGRASDDIQIATVLCQVNGSDWLPASGTSNWTATANLVAGPNVIRTYTVDSVGNTSVTNTLTLTLVVNNSLTLITNGLGRITANFRTNWLEIGKPYIVTAVPGPGQVFSNWVGGASSGSATLNFVMSSNLVLQANFIPNPFLQATGIFNGLFQEPTRTHDHSGFFTLTLSSGGGYSTRVQVGTASYSASGQLSLTGTANINIARRGLTPLQLAVAVDLVGGKLLTGTVGDGTWLAEVTAERAPFNAKSNPANQYLGKYNLMIPGGDFADASFPAGDGYGNVSIDVSGKISLSGALADGSTLPQSIAVSGAGHWPLYVPLYGGKGSLQGWLNFDTNQPSGGLDGLVSWIRPAQKTALYPNGFTNVILAAGSRYTPPVGMTNRVIALTNGVLSLEGGNLSAPFTNAIVLSSANRVSNASLTNRFTLSLTAASGFFKGSVVPAGSSRALAVQGVIYQDLGAGYGYFLGTNQSGRVYFGP